MPRIISQKTQSADKVGGMVPFLTGEPRNSFRICWPSHTPLRREQKASDRFLPETGAIFLSCEFPTHPRFRANFAMCSNEYPQFPFHRELVHNENHCFRFSMNSHPPHFIFHTSSFIFFSERVPIKATLIYDIISLVQEIRNFV